MEKHTRTVTFVGGPLDGLTRNVAAGDKVYKHEQPPTSDDIRTGEVPVGFFPPMHEYIYVEEQEGSGTFVYTEQHHQ